MERIRKEIMDTETVEMTLDELIEAAQQRIEQTEALRMAEETKRLAKDMWDMEIVLNSIREALPMALREYVSFGRWHKPNYEFRELWNAEVEISAPGMAVIRVYLETSKIQKNDEDEEINGAKILERGSQSPFHILRYGCRKGDEGYEIHLSEEYSTNNLDEAIEQAVAVGDTWLDAVREIPKRNAELSEKPQELITLSHYDELRKTLDMAREMEAESGINMVSRQVMAAALVDIAESLKDLEGISYE